MIKAKRIFSWIWLALLSFPVFAIHYNFKTYSLEEGLAQSQVYCVIQDSRGYIWCGTFGGGVCRFDGKSFEIFSEKDGLSSNVIYTILEDSKGNLWFGGDEGITKYDRKTFTRYTPGKGSINDTILTIFEDRSGELWFGAYNGGISKFNGKTFENYTTDDGLPNNRVYSIMQDRIGDLWIGTLAGACKFDIENKKFTNYTYKKGLHNIKTSYILEDCKGDIWFAATAGVFKYNGRTFTQFTTAEGLCDNQVDVILQDRKGNYWFGTKMGASEYDGAVFTNYKTENGLAHNKVNSLCEDREGNLWFGTGGGLCMLGGKMFSHLSVKDGLKSDMVWAFRQDKKGVMWISTDAGISRYYGEDFPVTTSRDGVLREAAYPFVEDRRGNIWFATSEYIMRYNGQTFNNLTFEMGLSKYLVLDIFEDSSANIWIGTQDGGVKKFDGKHFRELTAADGLVHNTVNMIKEDKQGNMVFATDGGLSIYNGKTFQNITVKDGLPSRYMMCVLIDARNNYWLGTYGRGAVKYTPRTRDRAGRFDSFTVKDGLNDNVVLSMIFDDSGNILIGTNKGMNILDAAEYERTGEKRIKSYDRYDGFSGIECNQNAVFKDKDGAIWFGTVKGAVRYNPHEAETNEKEPLTYITALKLFFESSDLSPYAKGFEESGLPLNLKLPHTKNHITFDFIGISLKAPEKVKYRVKLDGFEKNWTPVSKATSATYSNLPSGDFTFKVKACNNNGVWNKYPAAFHFRIAAPFWQQWWFFLLGFACAAGCIYLFIKIRTHSLENRQKLLEEKINERTLELQLEKAKVEKINLELEQRVQERTEVLTRVNKRLLQAQKMEAIGRLASGVAHDLNNVLAGVVTLPEILAQKMSDADPLKEYLLMIQASGEKAAAIVQDLLTLARRGIATFVNMNLNEVITDYLNSLEYAKLKKSHPRMEMKTDFDKDIYQILGSPIHLAKTIMNLVANAAEAMPSGGKITIITRNRCLDKPISGYDQVVPGDYVVLIIVDEGIGISPDDLEKIFEPFYTKKHMGRSGTGLGMAVVWGAVQDHNGYIEIQSTEGKGTTIALYFPKTTQDMEFEEFPAEKKEYISRGESILVVDDELEQREIASLALTDLGYKVAAVSSGEEAIRYMEQHTVDLMILDMIMEPGIDGCETFKNIVKFKPGQKAIIVSGFSEDERVKKAQKMGAGVFVKKPYLRDEIYTAVRTELERSTISSNRT